jgi:hypothetical protein
MIRRVLESAGVVSSRRRARARGEAEEMSHGTKQDELARKARQAFLKEERDHQVEQRIADEAKRQTDTAAKTAKLRELRLAKEAADCAAAPKAKPRKGAGK